MATFDLVAIIIAIALVFDYINGFHDAANSIATVVATRVLTPFQAVLWAAFFNFVAAFLFGTAVAKTVGRGFVDLDLVTPYVILAGLSGAIVWDLITWWLGLPTFLTRALIGGYAGAAIARVSLLRGWNHCFEALNVGPNGEWPFTLKMIVGAPLIGMVSAYTLMIIVYWLFRNSTPSKMDKYFRKLQLAFGGGVQPLPRLQRRAEDHGRHHRRAVYGAPDRCLRSALLGAPGLLLGHRAGHAQRRLANRPHHGRAPDAPEAAQRLLRGDGRGGCGAAFHPPGDSRSPPLTPSPAPSPAWAVSNA